MILIDWISEFFDGVTIVWRAVTSPEPRRGDVWRSRIDPSITIQVLGVSYTRADMMADHERSGKIDGPAKKMSEATIKFLHHETGEMQTQEVVSLINFWKFERRGTVAVRI